MANEEFNHCILPLLKDIGYRHEPFPPHDALYWDTFHQWILEALGPTSSFDDKQLAELAQTSGTIIERSYPYTITEFKLLYAKLTAISILIDDSIEDETLYQHLVQFSTKIYRGQAQENALLALYVSALKELSQIHEKDAVLRNLAILPWINHVDACLIEKQLIILERERSKAEGAELSRLAREDSLASKFPHYLRYKSGFSDTYVAAIFKAHREQYVPLNKYLKAVPDMISFIEIINDVLSFHKEEMDGETYNLIHLRTRSIAASGSMAGTGPKGTWTPYDTLRLLCDELRDATHRIDGLLRLEECERKLRGESGLNDIDDVDVTIAMQWRGWRHGYISWHLECRRYKLDFLKSMVVAEQNGEKPNGRY
ncbi:terpenoid synthase [Favolaschia claudopus]|uniref:Terpenoid synthase n=1 Tax=Favolaschia claudopus TaxID=2862362 RepID=A0AAW0D9F0_9AGAR